jgi:predicted outer membrane protein
MTVTWKHARRCAIAVAALGAASAGCGSNSFGPDGAVQHDLSVVVVDAGVPVVDASIPLTNLTPGQVAGLGLAGNNAAIAEGNLALQKSTNQQVLAFANKQVQQATAANQAGMAVLASAGITPAASAASQAVDAQTQTTINTLTPLTGTTFDAAYLQSQVVLNQQVVSITNALMPTITNQTLLLLVQQSQTTANQNIASAQQILTTLPQ